jgi:hypothetical protein
LLYIIFAVAMWVQAGKDRPALRLFAPASFVVGVSSFAYHASYTYFFQVFDFIGMFCFLMVSIVLNARRLGQLSPHLVKVAFAGSVTACTALLLIAPYIGFPIQIIVVALILLMLVQEIVLKSYYSRHPALRPKYGTFIWAVSLLLVAFGFSLADMLRIWCEPDNHVINGHSIWHILTAVVLYLLFCFHSQFAYDGASSSASAALLPLRSSTK